MTTPRPHTRTTVWRANLVDVPAIARLATSAPASLPLSPDSPGAPDLSREQMQGAMRLMMAHHALEDGQIWVSEDADGTLLAVGVWLPPDTGIEPPQERLGTLFSRELDAPPPETPDLSQALKEAYPDGPHWKLIIFCSADHAGAWSTELAGELLRPGAAVVDEADAAAVAIVLSPDQPASLRPLGFGQPREVQLAPEARVWLMTRDPSSIRRA